LEEEEDAGSYLNDLNRAPDFVDEAPIEEASEILSLYISRDTQQTFSQTESSRPEAIRAAGS